MKNNSSASNLWNQFIAEYPIEKLWKLLLSVAMPLAFVFIFVGNAVSYYPYWSYSIYNYSYESPFLIGLPMAIIAVFAIWKNRPLISFGASIIFLIPIIHAMIYNASEPAKLTAVFYLELIFSLTSAICSIIPYLKRDQSRSDIKTNNDFSVADEIGKYKKLLDDGVITEAEYEAKKKELLK